jgi:hypothetical protein
MDAWHLRPILLWPGVLLLSGSTSDSRLELEATESCENDGLRERRVGSGPCASEIWGLATGVDLA